MQPARSKALFASTLAWPAHSLEAAAQHRPSGVQPGIRRGILVDIGLPNLFGAASLAEALDATKFSPGKHLMAPHICDFFRESGLRVPDAGISDGSLGTSDEGFYQ